ncbi:hypothetical protein DIE19_27410, partial [Burkholderia sp. Bp9126]
MAAANDAHRVIADDWLRRAIDGIRAMHLDDDERRRKHPAKTPLGVNCRHSSGDGCPTMRQQRGDVVGAVGRQAI